MKSNSVIFIDEPELVKGKKVLVVEDSPTVTHGGLPYAAGYAAAKKYGAAEIVDPRPYAVGSLKEIYETYKHMGPVLPSLGYTPQQRMDLEETIANTPADTVILGTPSDLTKVIKIGKPVVKVRYELNIIEGPSIKELIDEFLKKVRYFS